MRPPKPHLVASPEWTPRGRRMVDLPVPLLVVALPCLEKHQVDDRDIILLYPAMPLELHCSVTLLELHCSARPLELQCSARPTLLCKTLGATLLRKTIGATMLCKIIGATLLRKTIGAIQSSARPLEPHCSARSLVLHCSAKPLGLHCSARPLELPCSARPLELHCASRSVAGLTWPAFVYSNHQVTGSYYALQSACSAECSMPFWIPHCLYHVTFFFFLSTLACLYTPQTLRCLLPGTT